MYGWVDGWMDGWMDGRMEEGREEGTDSQTDGRMVTEMGAWEMRRKRERGRRILHR